MAYDGSGTFTLTYTWATEAASPPIAISKLDTEFAGIATGLSTCLLKNGTSVPSADMPWNGKKITGLGNAAADTDALNRQTADARYAQLGGPTFTGEVIISSTQPLFWLIESDAASDEKRWLFQSSGGDFSLNIYNDAVTVGATPVAIGRTGTTVDLIAFAGTTIALTGNGTVSGTLAVAGNVAVNTNKFTVAAATGNTVVAGTLSVNAIDITPTSGTFTAYLRATNNGADIASGTATWRKANGIVTLYLPGLTATSAVTDPLYIDGLPAAICPVTAAQYLLASGYDAGAETALKVMVPVSGDYLIIRPFNSSTFTAGSSVKGIVSSVLMWAM